VDQRDIGKRNDIQNWTCLGKKHEKKLFMQLYWKFALPEVYVVLKTFRDLPVL